MTVSRLSVLVLVILALAAPAGFALVPQAKQAPTFTLQTAAGQAVNLAKLRGKPVVLDFWAPWCLPCRRAMPELQKLQAKYAKQGVTVVGVAVDGSDAEIAAAVRQAGVKYAVVIDRDRKVGAAYQVYLLPTLYVLDKSGKVVLAETGFNGRRVEQALAKALK